MAVMDTADDFGFGQKELDDKKTSERDQLAEEIDLVLEKSPALEHELRNSLEPDGVRMLDHLYSQPLSVIQDIKRRLREIPLEHERQEKLKIIKDALTKLPHAADYIKLAIPDGAYLLDHLDTAAYPRVIEMYKVLDAADLHAVPDAPVVKDAA